MAKITAGQVVAPNCFAKTFSESEALCADQSLTAIEGTPVNNALTAGLVVSQLPIAGADVDPNTDVVLILSLGPVVAARRRNIQHRRRTLPRFIP